MDIKELGQKLDQKIEQADNLSYAEQGIALSPKDIEIKLMGQVSLLADEEISSKIELEMTMDFDAHVKASFEISKILDELLKEKGMELDALSGEIWMPTDTTWELCYEGDHVKIYKASALDVLVSKAIKAPEKNRKLIQESIEIYGRELSVKITQYGGDPNYFKK